MVSVCQHQVCLLDKVVDPSPECFETHHNLLRMFFRCRPHHCTFSCTQFGIAFLEGVASRSMMSVFLCCMQDMMVANGRVGWRNSIETNIVDVPSFPLVSSAP